MVIVGLTIGLGTCFDCLSMAVVVTISLSVVLVSFAMVVIRAFVVSWSLIFEFLSSVFL